MYLLYEHLTVLIIIKNCSLFLNYYNKTNHGRFRLECGQKILSHKPTVLSRKPQQGSAAEEIVDAGIFLLIDQFYRR